MPSGCPGTASISFLALGNTSHLILFPGGDYMDYAWTLKMTMTNGTVKYTRLVDEGLFIKSKLLLSHVFINFLAIHDQYDQYFSRL